MNDSQTIGARIRARRKALGITQRDLSEITAVSLHTISDIESGKGNPTVATLQRVARPLGLVLELRLRSVR